MRSALLLISISLLFACEPCTDCNSEANPPTILTSLYDLDRLMEVEDSITLFDQIEISTDSLLIYGDSIVNFAKPYESKKQEFEAQIDALTDLRMNLEDSAFADARDSVEALLKKNQGFLKNGRTAIDILSINQTDFSESYDSARNHNIPLILNAEQTTFSIVVDDEEFEVDVIYTLSDELDTDNRVVRSAFIESLTQSGMDSVLCYCEGIEEKIPCTSFNCESENSSIACYF